MQLEPHGDHFLLSAVGGDRCCTLCYLPIVNIFMCKDTCDNCCIYWEMIVDMVFDC